PLRSWQRHRFLRFALILPVNHCRCLLSLFVFHNLIATMLPIANGSVTLQYMGVAQRLDAQSTCSSGCSTSPMVSNFLTGPSRQAVDQIWVRSPTKSSYRSFHFRPDLSCCPEETELSIANLAYFTLTNMLRYSSSVLQLDAPRSVKEILWGYDDPTLNLVADIAKIVGYKINPTIGLFYGKNGSDDGDLSVATWPWWTGGSSTPAYPTVDKQVVNMLNGTDGTMFPPFVDPKKRLYIYSTDICRSIYVTYAGPVFGASICCASLLLPEGFCVGGICLDSGVADLTTCQPDSADQFRGQCTSSCEGRCCSSMGARCAVGLVCFLALPVSLRVPASSSEEPAELQ
uniref:TGF_BETA_2 domain-containing protein n=1 Tax=Macrostomum lignano TaxID=282301 RepID=A0A1I8F9U0_9PLAT